MANGVKPASLATGLAVMVLLLISFLGGIYGTIKHRDRNKKKRLQSIVNHELAAEQGRQARENVEREIREEEKRKKKEEGKGMDVDQGKAEGGIAGGDEYRGRSRAVDEERGVEKAMDTEIGRVKVTLNGVEIDPDTGKERDQSSPEEIGHKIEEGHVRIVDEEKGQAPVRKKKRSKFSIYGKR